MAGGLPVALDIEQKEAYAISYIWNCGERYVSGLSKYVFYEADSQIASLLHFHRRDSLHAFGIWSHSVSSFSVCLCTSLLFYWGRCLFCSVRDISPLHSSKVSSLVNLGKEMYHPKLRNPFHFLFQRGKLCLHHNWILLNLAILMINYKEEL